MKNIDLKDISNYDFPMNEKFTLHVTSDDVNYEFLLYLKYDSDKIICMSYEAGKDLKLDTSVIWYKNPAEDNACCSHPCQIP